MPKRMYNTMYTSMPDRAAGVTTCPDLSDGRLWSPTVLGPRATFLKSDARRYSAKSDEVEFRGVLEVVPSNGRVAATVLRSTAETLASLPVTPIQ